MLHPTIHMKRRFFFAVVPAFNSRTAAVTHAVLERSRDCYVVCRCGRRHARRRTGLISRGRSHFCVRVERTNTKVEWTVPSGRRNTRSRGVAEKRLHGNKLSRVVDVPPGLGLVTLSKVHIGFLERRLSKWFDFGVVGVPGSRSGVRNP
jgi:hypothetical protein